MPVCLCSDLAYNWVSGHGYSLDGKTWHVAKEEPYNYTVPMASGRSVTMTTRERWDSNLHAHPAPHTHCLLSCCVASVLHHTKPKKCEMTLITW